MKIQALNGQGCYTLFRSLRFSFLCLTFLSRSYEKRPQPPFRQLQSSRSYVVLVFHGPLRRRGSHFAPLLCSFRPLILLSIRTKMLRPVIQAEYSASMGLCKLDNFSRGEGCSGLKSKIIAAITCAVYSLRIEGFSNMPRYEEPVKNLCCLNGISSTLKIFGLLLSKSYQSYYHQSDLLGQSTVV